MVNRTVKVSYIVKELQIAARSIENIIHTHLHMSKVSFRWVPQNLKLHDQHQHMALRQKLLDLYTSNKGKFCRHLFTGVETWIHHWDPESKLESMRWKHVEFLHPKKCRTQTSTSKGIVTIF